MKKRVLSLLLALVLLAALLPQTALISHAAASGTCGENLTWSFDEETGTLTITGSGAMTKWSAPERTPWNEHRAQIKSVILPNGLTNIGSCAFENCEALKKIVLPDSVTDIGKSAFSQCTALTGLSMPDGLLRIGNNAFYKCIELETVMIPKES